MLPTGFTSVAIGNNYGTGDVSFDETKKMITIKGSGNYIRKDSGASYSYQFLEFDVKGNATIIARLADFDIYVQEDVFIRKDNSKDNADYIGVHVESSKNQYRYAYRDNSAGSDSKATLTWNAVENVISYIVKRATSKNGKYTNIAEVNAPKIAYVDNDVVNFNTYYCKVMTKNEK